MDQYIGKMLDNRYEILERIGTGGMAVVYKAKCHRLNRLADAFKERQRHRGKIENNRVKNHAVRACQPCDQMIENQNCGKLIDKLQRSASAVLDDAQRHLVHRKTEFQRIF